MRRASSQLTRKILQEARETEPTDYEFPTTNLEPFHYLQLGESSGNKGSEEHNGSKQDQETLPYFLSGDETGREGDAASEDLDGEYEPGELLLQRVRFVLAKAWSEISSKRGERRLVQRGEKRRRTQRRTSLFLSPSWPSSHPPGRILTMLQNSTAKGRKRERGEGCIRVERSELGSNSSSGMRERFVYVPKDAGSESDT